MAAFAAGIVLFDGVEELDFAGPFEVFGMAAEEGLAIRPFTVALHRQAVTGAKGLRIVADHTVADAPDIDILVVPGGRGTRPLLTDAGAVEAIRAIAQDCAWVLSVCTGALVLGKAGLLDGRAATTHWAAMDELAAAAPKARLSPGRRYVCDRNVITSAGFSAGIDASLWLIGELFGEEAGAEVQRQMEYDPEPPFAMPRP